MDSRSKNVVGVADNTALMQLDTHNILENLKTRYRHDEIYTYTAHVLLSMNPFKTIPGLYGTEVMDRYRNKPFGSCPPHPYALADLAARKLRVDGEDQAIIVSGESGAGKTEAAKHLLSFLTTAPRDTRKPSGPVSAFSANPDLSQSTSECADIRQKIMLSNPLLEALGNACTVRNFNSSRFGKLNKLYFSRKAKATEYGGCGAAGLTVIGASISSYLLEGTRALTLAMHERNFHIFYQMLAGLSAEQLSELYLPSDHNRDNWRKFYFLNPELQHADNPAALASQGGVTPLTFEEDQRRFKEVQASFEALNVNEGIQVELFRLLAGILHLGQVLQSLRLGEPHEGSTEPSVYFEDEHALHCAAKLLGWHPNDLFAVLTTRQSRLGNGEVVTRYLTASQSRTQIHALVRALYTRTFTWLVHSISKELMGASASAVAEGLKLSSVGILDIYGFERVAVNHFEQLCINLANERLQDFFVRKVLVAEQEAYKQDGVPFESVDLPDDTKRVLATVTQPHGVSAFGVDGSFFSILDEQCRLHASNFKDVGQNFLNQVTSFANTNASSTIKFPPIITLTGSAAPNKRRSASPAGPSAAQIAQGGSTVSFRPARLSFTVKHYAGEVEYTLEPEPEGRSLPHSNSRPFSASSPRGSHSLSSGNTEVSITSWLDKNNDRVAADLDTLISNSAHPIVVLCSEQAQAEMEESAPASMNERAVRNQQQQSGPGGAPKGGFKSVSRQFVRDLDDLIASLDRCSTRFVRCFVPNRRAAANSVDDLHMAAQLEQSGTTQLVQIMSRGYPSRVKISDIVGKYKEGIIAAMGSTRGARESLNALSDREVIEFVLQAFELPPSQFTIGIVRVFMRAGNYAKLEALLGEDAETDENGQRPRLAPEVVRRIFKNINRKKVVKAWLATRFCMRLQIFHRKQAVLRQWDEAVHRAKLYLRVYNKWLKPSLDRFREKKRIAEELERQKRELAASYQAEMQRKREEEEEEQRRLFAIEEAMKKQQREAEARARAEAEAAAAEAAEAERQREEAEAAQQAAAALQQTRAPMDGPSLPGMMPQAENDLQFDPVSPARFKYLKEADPAYRYYSPDGRSVGSPQFVEPNANNHHSILLREQKLPFAHTPKQMDSDAAVFAADWRPDASVIPLPSSTHKDASATLLFNGSHLFVSLSSNNAAGKAQVKKSIPVRLQLTVPNYATSASSPSVEMAVAGRLPATSEGFFETEHYESISTPHADPPALVSCIAGGVGTDGVICIYDDLSVGVLRLDHSLAPAVVNKKYESAAQDLSCVALLPESAGSAAINPSGDFEVPHYATQTFTHVDSWLPQELKCANLRPLKVAVLPNSVAIQNMKKSNPQIANLLPTRVAIMAAPQDEYSLGRPITRPLGEQAAEVLLIVLEVLPLTAEVRILAKQVAFVPPAQHVFDDFRIPAATAIDRGLTTLGCLDLKPLASGSGVVLTGPGVLSVFALKPLVTPPGMNAVTIGPGGLVQHSGASLVVSGGAVSPSRQLISEMGVRGPSSPPSRPALAHPGALAIDAAAPSPKPRANHSAFEKNMLGHGHGFNPDRAYASAVYEPLLLDCVFEGAKSLPAFDPLRKQWITATHAIYHASVLDFKHIEDVKAAALKIKDADLENADNDDDLQCPPPFLTRRQVDVLSRVANGAQSSFAHPLQGLEEVVIGDGRGNVRSFFFRHDDYPMPARLAAYAPSATLQGHAQAAADQMPNLKDPQSLLMANQLTFDEASAPPRMPKLHNGSAVLPKLPSFRLVLHCAWSLGGPSGNFMSSNFVSQSIGGANAVARSSIASIVEHYNPAHEGEHGKKKMLLSLITQDGTILTLNANIASPVDACRVVTPELLAATRAHLPSAFLHNNKPAQLAHAAPANKQLNDATSSDSLNWSVATVDKVNLGDVLYRVDTKPFFEGEVSVATCCAVPASAQDVIAQGSGANFGDVCLFNNAEEVMIVVNALKASLKVYAEVRENEFFEEDEEDGQQQ